MYLPKYTITNKILKDIGRIEACREVIINAPLIPAWEAKFRKDAIIRTVHHGTHIEGNELNYSEAARIVEQAEINEKATNLAEKAGVVARDRDVQEVINYRNVLKCIEDYQQQNPQGDITEDVFKKIHKITAYRVLPLTQAGVYRTTQVVVKDSISGKVTFHPPPAVEAPFLLEDFFAWLNSSQSLDSHPVVRAGITHYELVHIHPFLDANGRVARAMATLVLFLAGYDIKRFFSLEEFYDKDAYHYYQALQSVQPEKTYDLTLWLEYFIEGLLIELNRIRERIRSLSADSVLKAKLGGKQVALSERQIKIIEHIQKMGFLQNQQFSDLFPMISEDTVLRELRVLIEWQIIKKAGRTKAAKYILK